MQAAGYRVTSIQAILHNVMRFLIHVDIFHKEESLLMSNEITELLNLVESLESHMHKVMAAQAEKVQTSKCFYVSGKRVKQKC